MVQSDPSRLGRVLRQLSGGLDYSKINHHGDYDLFEDEVEHDDLRYYTEILTERTVEFLERLHDRPCLLNLNFTTPHWPWEGPDDQAVSAELTQRIRAGERRSGRRLSAGRRQPGRPSVPRAARPGA